MSYHTNDQILQQDALISFLVFQHSLEFLLLACDVDRNADL